MLSVVEAVLLGVNVVVILAVGKTRHEEKWVGVGAVVWAALMAVWVVAADRTVQVSFCAWKGRLVLEGGLLM